MLAHGKGNLSPQVLHVDLGSNRYRLDREADAVTFRDAVVAVEKLLDERLVGQVHGLERQQPAFGNLFQVLGDSVDPGEVFRLDFKPR